MYFAPLVILAAGLWWLLYLWALDVGITKRVAMLMSGVTMILVVVVISFIFDAHFPPLH